MREVKHTSRPACTAACNQPNASILQPREVWKPDRGATSAHARGWGWGPSGKKCHHCTVDQGPHLAAGRLHTVYGCVCWPTISF